MKATANVGKAAIVASQVRGGRGLLGWSRERLAEESSVPVRTLDRLEAGETAPRRATLAAVEAALCGAGVEFIPENGGGPGVRLRKPSL